VSCEQLLQPASGPGGRAGRDAVKTLLSGGQHALARSSAQIFAGRRSVSER
jgi:hypothetical protein